MLLYSDTLALLFLQLALASPWTAAASRLNALKGCPSCKGSLGAKAGPPAQKTQQQSGEHSSSSSGSTSILAMGEPCGVYTLSCARGLRCTPSQADPSPLRALLQGRGVCSNASSTGPAERPQPTASSDPTASEDLEKAPCRRLLNTVLKGVEILVFQSDRDIYMPNCDRRGFFRKKQCRSSRGMQRGHCWCVDENGTAKPSRTSPEGSLLCDHA